VTFQHLSEVHTSWVPADALEHVNHQLAIDYEEKTSESNPFESLPTSTTTTTTTQPDPVEELYPILPRYSTVITLTEQERERIDSGWHELELNLATILTKLGHIEMKWDDFWGTMYR
jgi:hypothetical protein